MKDIVIQVEGKVFGQKRPLFSDWSVSIPPEFCTPGGRPTLRSLITRVVLAETEAFHQRQEERKLVQALPRADIERGLVKGKVDMGGRNLNQQVDPQQAVDNALQAFEDGVYYVFIDDEQQTELDAEVTIHSDSSMMFLRLVALAGG